VTQFTPATTFGDDGKKREPFPADQIHFSRPAKPTDNPFIESFNGSFRDECLNVNWFLSLEDAKEKIQLF
jgi:integrase-like protein